MTATADSAAAALFPGGDRDECRERLQIGVVQALGEVRPHQLRRIASTMSRRGIDDVAAAGVRRIVKLSAVGAAPGSPGAFWDWHDRVERRLMASEVPGVILRSSFYMTNVLSAAEQVAAEGRLCAPVAQARIAMIDPRDVGAAAAAVLSAPGHDGRTYALTGPAAITYAEVAAELSAATGRTVEFADVPDGEAKRGLVQSGLPDVVAEHVVEAFAMARRGVAEQVTATVESLTGRPPRDFAAFARDHARPFAPAAVGAGR
jgi:uncharacterized protein YbjT (DUF2867 family)